MPTKLTAAEKALFRRFLAERRGSSKTRKARKSSSKSRKSGSGSRSRIPASWKRKTTKEPACPGGVCRLTTKDPDEPASLAFTNALAKSRAKIQAPDDMDWYPTS